MTVISHLDNRASSAVLSTSEKISINTSISTLKTRLDLHFNGELSSQFLFGSYTRGTILPRNLDGRSDIDYLIVFKDGNVKPLTLINRLRRFSEKYYSASERAQSHPTMVLKLNHISFDLVPAITGYLAEYRIPAPYKSYEEWMYTAPNDFNTALVEANANCGMKLKPTIRLLKYWNALARYPFESFELEKHVAAQYYWPRSSVRDLFFQGIDSLNLGYLSAQWKIDALNRAKRIVDTTRTYERLDMPASAESEIKKLIP